jgi:predicted alpha/beta superfamily hydrolase
MKINNLLTMPVIIFVMFSFFIIPNQAMAQEKGEPLVMGEIIKIHSKILNEDRPLWVHCPTNYKYSEAKYPVLYLLDGDAHFFHVTGIINFLSSLSNMPGMIVIALPNTDRSRDFLPTHVEEVPASGGADNFLKFFKEELIPYVEKNYRTASFRILCGHSYGGLFSVYTLLTIPELFNAYIAISPSLYWDNRLLFKKAEILFKKQPALKKFLFYTMGGKEREQMQSAAKDFENLLKEKAPGGLEWHFQLMEKEDHATIPHRTVYNALETLYSGWGISFREPSLQEIDVLKKHFKTLSEKYGYRIPIPEEVINRLGYIILGQEKVEEAIKVFMFNVKSYPNSANVYDSLGEAYENNNQLELARKNYETACKRAKMNQDPRLEMFKKNLERVVKKKSGDRK